MREQGVCLWQWQGCVRAGGNLGSLLRVEWSLKLKGKLYEICVTTVHDGETWALRKEEVVKGEEFRDFRHR